MNNLSRKVLIFLSKNGVWRHASVGSREHRKLIKESFLPCASVDTIRDAESLRVAMCKLQYSGEDYTYPMRGDSLDDLARAGNEIEALYKHRKSGKSGFPVAMGA